MEANAEEEESVVVSAGQISSVDDMTLISTPAPLTASSAARARGYAAPRVKPRLRNFSLESDEGETRNSGSSNDRESLGLISSKLLADLDGSELPLGSLVASLPGKDDTIEQEEPEPGKESPRASESSPTIQTRLSQEMTAYAGSSRENTGVSSKSMVTVIKTSKDVTDSSAPSKTVDLVGGNQGMAPEEADHTIHQVALEAEDLEELEEVCFDLDGSSSDEEQIGQDQQPEVDQKNVAEHERAAAPLFPLQAAPHHPSIEEPAQESEMDGALRRLLEPRAAHDHRDSSLHFDTSSVNWGPSLDYGPSIRFDGSMKETEQPSKNFDKLSSNKVEHRGGAFNPFDGEYASFSGLAFGDEEFDMDENAAQALLEQDEQEFNKENLLNNEELSMMSIRDADDTYLNMTIGTYIGALSERVGSLDAHKTRRPDFGMEIFSPPARRPVAPPLFNPEDETDARLPATDNSTPFELNTDDITFSSFHELFERSDMNISDMVGPDQNHTEFLLAFLRQHALEKRAKMAGSNDKIYSESRGADLGAATSLEKADVPAIPVTDQEKNPSGCNDRVGDQGDVAVTIRETADNIEALAEDKTLERLGEEAGGDASAGKIGKHSKDFCNVARGVVDVPPHTRGSHERTEFRMVSGDKASVTSVNEGDRCRETSEKPALTTKEISFLDDNSIFKVPFPVTSKNVRSKGKQQPFKSRIPLHVVSNSSKPNSSSQFKQLPQNNRTSLDTNPRKPEQTTGFSKKLDSTVEPMSNLPSVDRLKVHHPANKPSAVGRKVTGDEGRRAVSEPTRHDKRQQSADREAEEEADESLTTRGRCPDSTSKSLWSNMTLTEQSITSDTLTLSCLVPETQPTRPGQVPVPKSSQSSSATTTTRAQEESSVIPPNLTCKSSLDQSQLSKMTTLFQPSHHTAGTTTVSNFVTLEGIPGCTSMTVSDATLQQQHGNKRNTMAVSATDQTRLPEGSRGAWGLPPDVSKTQLDCMEETLAMDTVTDESLLRTMLASSTSLATTAGTTQLAAHQFASSTPLPGQDSRLTFHMDKTEASIVPLMTPKTSLDLVRVLQEVCMPEMCCVSLSCTALLPLTNVLPRGVKCVFAITAVVVTQGEGLPQQRLALARCPFDLKREITLAPRTSQNVVIIFRPKDQGTFMAEVKMTAAPLSSPEEKRVYTITLIGQAEYPTLEISPASEEMDFGDMLLGSTACKSIRIKNVGQATVPLCFSLFRTDSSQCMFSFHPETPAAADVSSISLTSRPSGTAALGNSIFSISLPGRTEGQEVKAETVKVFCNTYAPGKRDLSRYLAKAERFQAKLMVCVDQPVEELAPLATVILKVNVGLYKLHVDTSELNISAWPGASGSSTVKLVNSGSIPMSVKVFLEPSNDHFRVSPVGNVLIPPSGGGNTVSIPVTVSFTPQPTRQESGDHKVNVMFSNQVRDYYIPVTGRLKMRPVKFSSSTTHLCFGGVQLGQTGKEKISFVVDKDVRIRLSFSQTSQAFQLIDPEGERPVDSLELKATRDKKHTLWVTFCPEVAEFYSASLVIQELYANQYRISLSGYGGCSILHLEHVNPADSETSFWLDMGHLSAGRSLFRKFVVRNSGARCCFVKMTFCDTSRTEYRPTRATVMPSALILPPHESKELLVMFCPSQKEVDLCLAAHALVAFIKLEYCDNIVREMFLRYAGQQRPQAVSSYDVPVSASVREVVDQELVGMSTVPDSYALLMKSMRKVKIGLFGETVKADSSADSVVTSHSEFGPRVSSQVHPLAVTETPRPALTPINLNLSPRPGSLHIISFPHTLVGNISDVTHTFKNFDKSPLSWRLTPFAPAYVKESSGSETVQPVGYTVFKLSPLEGTLQSGTIQKVCVRFCPQRPGFYDQAWMMVDTRNSDKQVHRFIINAEALRDSPTRLPAEQPHRPLSGSAPLTGFSTTSSAPGVDRAREQPERHLTSPITSKSEKRFGHGDRSPQHRGETSSHRQTQESRSRNSSASSSRTTASDAAYKSWASAGREEIEPHEPAPGETPKVQAYWSRVEHGSSLVLGTLATAGRAVTPRGAVSPALSSISGSSSAAGRKPKRVGSSSSSSTPSSSSSSHCPVLSSHNRTSESRSDQSLSERRSKGLHLVHTTLEFPAVQVGHNSIHKVFIKNQTSQDAQISVEYEPRPPFLIKHTKFKVSGGKMMIFPVTFKPRHVDRFRDKIVFLDTTTGKELTATLEAEAKSADVLAPLL